MSSKRVRLRALDNLIVAACEQAKGNYKKAARYLAKAAEEEDFDDSITTLYHANEEGWEETSSDLSQTAIDGIEEVEEIEEENEDEGEIEYSTKRRRKVEADIDESELDGDLSDDDFADSLDEDLDDLIESALEDEDEDVDININVSESDSDDSDESESDIQEAKLRKKRREQASRNIQKLRCK